MWRKSGFERCSDAWSLKIRFPPSCSTGVFTISNLPCTYGLGKSIEKATLPRGTDNLVMVLFQSAGLPSDTTLRNAVSLQAMITAGAATATFSGYAHKVLSASDISIVYDMSTFSGKLSIPIAQVWNPAGGAVNNVIGKSGLFYRPTAGAALTDYLPLGIFDASGSASGGSYTHTIGSIVV